MAARAEENTESGRAMRRIRLNYVLGAGHGLGAAPQPPARSPAGGARAGLDLRRRARAGALLPPRLGRAQALGARARPAADPVGEGPGRAPVRVRRQAAARRAPGAGPPAAADRGPARGPRARVRDRLRRLGACAVLPRQPRRGARRARRGGAHARPAPGHPLHRQRGRDPCVERGPLHHGRLPRTPAGGARTRCRSAPTSRCCAPACTS